MVNIHGDYDSFSLTLDGSAIGHYIVYFAYTVQPGDMDTDGVVLSVDPLGRASDRNIEYALDNRVSMELSYPAQTPGAGHQVDGSQISGCDAVHCAYVTAIEDSEYTDPRKVAGFFAFDKLGDLEGNISGRLWSYGNREYFFLRYIVDSVKPTGSAPVASQPEVWFTQPLRNRAIERLGWELGGRVFAFDDADAFTFGAPTSEEDGHEQLQAYFWSTTGVRWKDGDRVLIKIVEVPVTATFDAASYASDEGDTFDVTVTLGDSFETKTVTLPLVATGGGGATSADFSGVPSELVFMPGETEKTFTVQLTDDTLDDDDESIILSFGTSTPAATVKDGGANETATVTIRDDDDPEVEVEFGSATYSAGEGGTVDVQVTLSADPERTVVIPLDATNREGATSTDYSGVPNSVTFNPGATTTTFTFMATQDTVDDDGESVRLAFGPPPDRVSRGTVDETTVNIRDDDNPRITVQFGSATYSADEGATTTVQVTLSADPERPVTIPLTTTNLLGASSLDYSGVPENVMFNTGETTTTFTFSVTQDTVDDDGEEVRLGIGTTLPDRVSNGTPASADVNLGDDDDPEVEVEFASASYSAGEGESVDVQLTLSADPERTVVIPLVAINQGGATSSDYSAPNSVTFNSGQTVQNVTVRVEQDTLDDDDESVKLTLGLTLPSRVTGGTQRETVVSFTDNDDPEVTVGFATTTYSAREGETANVKVTLNADPERTVIIPIVPTDQDGAASTDYSTPLSVRFDTGETEQTLAFSATQDDEDDDGESVRLAFGSLPARVTEGAVDETTVSLEDDDNPRITVWFGSAAHAVDEGATTSVQVVLSADPERTVTIPLTTTNLLGASASDYSVPTSVTLDAGETTTTFTFGVTQDEVDDDGESVQLGFGALPDRVSEGTPASSEVSLGDDDDPEVRVQFSQAVYTVAEGGSATHGSHPERRPRADGDHPADQYGAGRHLGRRLLGHSLQPDLQCGRHLQGLPLQGRPGRYRRRRRERAAGLRDAAAPGEHGRCGQPHGIDHGRRRAVGYRELRTGRVHGGGGKGRYRDGGPERTPGAQRYCAHREVGAARDI